MKQEMYPHIQQVEQSHWWYVARRKIIFEWVLQTLANYPAPNILDVGCGTGFNMEYLQTTGYAHTVGLDFAPEALNFCRSRHLPRLFCADGTRPPLRRESFELIMALDLIEHLADDISALRELSRLLKPSGSLAIFTPAFNFLWGLQDEVSYHYRRYTANELRRKLEVSGLTVNRLSYVNMFLLPLIWSGRTILRLSGNSIQGTSENDLHPGWSNGLLQTVFSAERFLLRRWNLPVGVSLFCIARKPG